MNVTTTYDDPLVRRIESDQNIIAEACRKYGPTPSNIFKKARFFYQTLVLHFHSYRMLWRIAQFERSKCFTCEKGESCKVSMRDFLEKATDCMRLLVKYEKKTNVLIRKMNRYLLVRYEDKLENYWISSDEIKALVHELSDKASRSNAR